MEQILEKLLGSVPKARVLRLFLRNSGERFGLDEISTRTQLRQQAARSEIRKFIELGLLQETMVKQEVIRKNGKKGVARKRAIYGVNPAFPFIAELRDFVSKSSVAPQNKILRQIKGVGKVKLAVISGVFIQSENSRTDLLIVGDGIQKRKLDRFLAKTESEIGRPIHHTVMETEEFQYRMDMYDRFLRDILEYPHEKIINRFNI